MPQPSRQEPEVEFAPGDLRAIQNFSRTEVARVVDLIRRDPKVRAKLGEPSIDELPEGAFLLRRENRSVALRPGITGELGRRDLEFLANVGLTGPAIYVNVVECPVCITTAETDYNVLLEIVDQLGV